MCDYSLQGLKNRLAVEGETLVVHRFRTGSIGMAAAADLRSNIKVTRSPWQRLLGIGHRAPKADCAVCIPPGAKLILRDTPQRLRRELGIRDMEEVVFTQITAAANAYRDAVRFRNGAELLLQRLDEGQRVDVVSVSVLEPIETESVNPTTVPDQARHLMNWA